MSIYTDLAGVIVDVCNQEGRHLDGDQFEALTPTCTLEERFAVLDELPMWAQRQIATPKGGLLWAA